MEKRDGEECKLNEKDTSNGKTEMKWKRCEEWKFVYLVYFIFILLVFFAAISFSRIERILKTSYKTYTYILPFCLITTMWKHGMHLENENGCYGTRVGHWTLQPDWTHQSRAYRASSNQSKQNWIDRLNSCSLSVSLHTHSVLFVHPFDCSLWCCYCFIFCFSKHMSIEWHLVYIHFQCYMVTMMCLCNVQKFHV